MVVGTAPSVKHNLKEGQPDKDAPQRGGSNTHLPPAANEDKVGVSLSSHETCKSCGSLADKCSCDDCECHVCSSKKGTREQIEPPIKSATSPTVVCSGGCTAAAQRAATGGCPGCECLAGGCRCTKCGCPVCGPTQTASKPMPCCGGNEAGKRATAGNCPACGCPSGNCPCTNCQCPVCKST